jgi:hypothetical protein
VSIKPTSFNTPQPFEQYAGEQQRRRTAAAAAAYGAGAGAAATGSAAIGNLKIAGTKSGQASLKLLHARLAATKHPAAPQIAELHRLGGIAARHKVGTSAATAGLAVAGAGLGALHQFRSNEEQGMSQDIGRFKAGTTYQNQQNRVASKGMVRTAALASDLDWSAEGKIARAGQHVLENKKKYAVGTAAASGAAGASTMGLLATKRRAERKRLADAVQIQKPAGPPMTIVKLYERDRRVSPVRAVGLTAGVGALAWGAPRSRLVRNQLRVQGARTDIGPNVKGVLNLAEGARSSLQHHGDAAIAAAHWPDALRDAIERVPASIRPEVATIAGAILVSHSRPVVQTRYRQVN